MKRNHGCSAESSSTAGLLNQSSLTPSSSLSSTDYLHQSQNSLLAGIAL